MARLSRGLAGVCAVLLFTLACGRPAKTLLAKDVMDFNTLFSENCAGCHGVDGKRGAAPLLNYPLYLALIPKDRLRHTIENGVPGTPMPAFAQSMGGPLYPAQIDAVVNGIENEWSQQVSANAATLPPYTASAGLADAALGQQTFIAACGRCHGEHGKAGPIENASFVSLVSDQGLRTAAIVGRPDFGMPDWRGKMPGHTLTNQEIGNVVAYLASFRTPANGLPEGGSSAPLSVEGNMPSGSSSQGGVGSSATKSGADKKR